MVLHGGLGNARRIASQRSESALNMNGVAEEGGFVVAYLNGTPITRFPGSDKLGGNAGSCCGVPVEKKVNDVGYIQAAVQDIATRYGIERSRIFGVVVVWHIRAAHWVFTSLPSLVSFGGKLGVIRQHRRVVGNASLVGVDQRGHFFDQIGGHMVQPA